MKILAKVLIGGPTGRIGCLAAACVMLFLGLGPGALGDEARLNYAARLQEEYRAAKQRYEGERRDVAAACEFSRICAELADLATSKDERARIATEGIEAGRYVVAQATTNAAGHYYMAINIGELAQTKLIGALSLVKDMEQELIEALRLDPAIEHGGPDRSLGMLYRDAPGRPFSIGSKTKAREHLEHALQVAPDYPDNFLTLMEAELKWDDDEALVKLMTKYKAVLPAAREKYQGARWEQAWRDWAERWEAVQKRE